MNKKWVEEVSLYCSVDDDVVTWIVGQEIKEALGIRGYVQHSAYCLKYVEQRCKSYNTTGECRYLRKQAESFIRDNYFSD